MPNSSVNGIPLDFCTLQTCPISDAQVHYDPTLAGNALYSVIFVCLLVAQIIQGIRYRTWTFTSALFGGLLLEIIGYAGRILMHFNPFNFNNFLIYLICLTIGPNFLSAAIYMCLARIVVVYGEEYSRFRPRTYTIMFIACDFCSLVLQAVGGAIAATSSGPAAENTGVHIMVGGLAFQVASLAVFAILSADFAWSVRKNRGVTPSVHSATFIALLFALAFATLFIFIRSCFRVAELSSGFASALANDQVTFMVLEGAMIVLASLALTVFHPGRCFDGGWKNATYSFGTSGAGSKTA